MNFKLNKRLFCVVSLVFFRGVTFADEPAPTISSPGELSNCIQQGGKLCVKCADGSTALPCPPGVACIVECIPGGQPCPSGQQTCSSTQCPGGGGLTYVAPDATCYNGNLPPGSWFIVPGKVDKYPADFSLGLNAISVPNTNSNCDECFVWEIVEGDEFAEFISDSQNTNVVYPSADWTSTPHITLKTLQPGIVTVKVTDNQLSALCGVMQQISYTFEVKGGLGLGDADGDGLINEQECIEFQTDPFRYDTDGDGLSDGEEVLIGTDPLKLDSDADTVPDGDEDQDGDGLTNLVEWNYSTNPVDPDSDGDNVFDGMEVAQHSDPNDSSDEGQAPNPSQFIVVSPHISASFYDSASFTLNGGIWSFEVGPIRVRNTEVVGGPGNCTAGGICNPYCYSKHNQSRCFWIKSDQSYQAKLTNISPPYDSKAFGNFGLTSSLILNNYPLENCPQAGWCAITPEPWLLPLSQELCGQDQDPGQWVSYVESQPASSFSFLVESCSDENGPPKKSDPNLKIEYVPKVVAADSQADVPIYFKIDGLEAYDNKAFVHSVKVRFELGWREGSGVTWEEKLSTVISSVVSDDAVTKAEPGAGAPAEITRQIIPNGETNHYTVFVPESLFDTFDSPLTVKGKESYFDPYARFQIEAEITPHGSEGTTLLTSDYQKILGFIDRNIEVIELGVSESISAMKAQTHQKEKVWREGIPLLHHLGKEQAGADHSGHPGHNTGGLYDPYNPYPCYGDYCSYPHYEYGSFVAQCGNPYANCSKEPIPAPQSNLAVGFGAPVSGHSGGADWRTITNTNFGYTIEAGLIAADTGYGFSFGTGDRYATRVNSHIRGAYFVVYYGRKNVQGYGHSVIDVKQNFGSLNFELFPGSTFELQVQDVDGTERTWVGVVSIALDTTSNALSLLSAFTSSYPALSAGLGIAGTSCSIMNSALDLYNRKYPKKASDGAYASVGGGLTVMKEDGTVATDNFWDDPIGGDVGAPGLASNTLNANGSISVSGSVRLNNYPASVLWGVRLFNIASVEASAVASDSAMSKVQFIHPPGFDSTVGLVGGSTALIGSAEGQVNQGLGQ